MANPRRCPFVLDFQNGREVEDILKKAQNLADIQTIGNGLNLDENGELSASIDSYTKEETNTLLGGKADLVNGKVPASELPSYVDDTVEGYYYNGNFYEDSEHTRVITGETGKIYIDLTANKSYRWTGSVYVRVDECPAFGETQGTIYEGNKGKANADAIGDLSSLTTTVKTDLVSAINEINGTIGSINTVLEEVL